MRTTTVGSYPTDGLAPEAALARAVQDQVAAGVDLLTDGQVCGDMIGGVLAHLPGCVRRPDGRWAVVAPIQPPPGPITVADWRRAVSLAEGRPVKAVLTGPTTLACAVVVEPGAPYGGPGDRRLVGDLAAVLKAEVGALAQAGATAIQLDEPFFSLPGVDVGQGLAAVRQVIACAGAPWLHCCGDLRSAWGLLRHAPVAVLQIEGTRLERLPTLREGVGPSLGLGVVDSATDAVEPPEAIGRRIDQLGAAGAPPDFWVSPDCGLRLRTRAAARAKLASMVAAADRA